MDKTTIYSNVEFRGKPGKLRLTSEKLAFKPDDWSDGFYDSWRWTSAQKHQVTSKTAKRALLKLVSKDDASKSVVFTFATHQELETVRNDVTERLRKVRSGDSGTRRSSIDSIGQGEFLAKQTRRDSTMSISNYSFNDIDMSLSGGSLHMDPDGLDMSEMDNSLNVINSERRSGLLLDPVSVTGAGKTASKAKTAPNTKKSTTKNATKAKKTKTPKKTLKKKSTNRSVPQIKTSTIETVPDLVASPNGQSQSARSSSLLLTVVAFCVAIIAVYAGGSLGCFNGKLENLQLERMFPSFQVNPPAKEQKKGLFQKCGIISRVMGSPCQE